MEKIKGLDIENIESLPEEHGDVLKLMIAVGNRTLYTARNKEDDEKVIISDKATGEELFSISNKTDMAKIFCTAYTDEEINTDVSIAANIGDKAYAIAACHGYGSSIREKIYYLDEKSITGGIVTNITYSTSNCRCIVGLMTGSVKPIELDNIQLFSSLSELFEVCNNERVRQGFSSEEDLWNYVNSIRRYKYKARVGYWLNSELDIPDIEESIPTRTIHVDFDSDSESDLGGKFIKGNGYTLGDWYCTVSNKYIGPLKKFRFDSYRSDGTLNISLDNKEIVIKQQRFDVSVLIDMNDCD